MQGVEAETCPSFAEAQQAGHPVQAPVKSSLADGLAVPFVGGNSLVTAKGLIDKMVTVCEESIALSILRLLEMEKVGWQTERQTVTMTATDPLLSGRS